MSGWDERFLRVRRREWPPIINALVIAVACIVAALAQNYVPLAIIGGAALASAAFMAVNGFPREVS